MITIVAIGFFIWGSLLLPVGIYFGITEGFNDPNKAYTRLMITGALWIASTVFLFGWV